MAQVTVTIAKHVYRVACGEGEEAHLQGLARQIDQRIEKLKKDFGEIGDQRLTIMAAITIADELVEAKRRITELDVEILNLTSKETDRTSERDEWADRLADSIGETAARVERVAQNLNTLSRS
ncbi:MAG: cell division protein ZapA [Methylovirgula sp.]|uniref:cell division protein ZapA n=1 Tax=Methylovirgula sp. TaxID=1978224 RepID=UPI002EEBD79E